MLPATFRGARRMSPGLRLPSLLPATARGTEAQPVGSCTAPRSRAIEVAVSDSASGLALADSAVGSLQAGNYADALQHSLDSSLLLPGGSELGTDDVSVSRPGYMAWSRIGVAVTQVGPCGNVEPVHLDARLQAAP
jgi:hypothetical protein